MTKYTVACALNSLSLFIIINRTASRLCLRSCF